MKSKRYILLALMMALSAISVLVYTEYPLGNQAESKVPEKKGKLRIIATLFPQYDFTKQIVKDRADVELLLPPGVESHTYEPSPSDIVKINKADMFIYTGKYMEQWAEKIISGITKSNLMVVDVSEKIKLSKQGESEGEETYISHNHAVDPHIWTDPNNAMIMTENILSALCTADPLNSAFYKNNAKNYQEQLVVLDKEFKDTVAHGKRNKVVFGGSNAFHYFMKRYVLDCMAAHDTCSAQAEASARKVAELVDEIRKDKIPVIFYEEMVAPKVAYTIGSETGTKMLRLNSCHNLMQEEIDKGATYISIMENNLANLKEGLR